MHDERSRGPIRNPGPTAPVHATGNDIPYGRNSLEHLEEGGKRRHECRASRFASHHGSGAGPLASITQTSAGNVAQGPPLRPATFLFTENSANALQTTGTMTVTITDSAAGNTVTWAGTPVVIRADSLARAPRSSATS